MEYEAALLWYKQRSQQAAENFVAAVNGSLLQICVRPDWWRNSYANYREIAVKKFPYTLIYILDEENAMASIVSVYHHKQDASRKYPQS